MNKLFAAVLCCFLLCFGLVLGLKLGEGAPEESRLSIQPLPEVVPVQETVPRTEVLPPENILLEADSGPGQNPIPDQAFPFPNGMFPGELMQSLLIPVVDDDPPNEELQKYVHSQASVSGKTVTITAIEEDGQYYSAQLASSIAFCYCDFTFQVKTVHGDGLFPAIWMLPASGMQLPEVDIYEALGNYPELVFGVMHYQKNGEQLQENYAKDAMAETHTIRLHWTEDQISWYVDGELQQTITDFVPREPMYLLINLAVGGNWPGSPTEETVFPAVFEVEVLDFHPTNIYLR